MSADVPPDENAVCARSAMVSASLWLLSAWTRAEAAGRPDVVARLDVAVFALREAWALLEGGEHVLPAALALASAMASLVTLRALAKALPEPRRAQVRQALTDAGRGLALAAAGFGVDDAALVAARKQLPR